jgi:hemerythrin
VPLRWTSALTVGVEEIDAQHQELFRRVDRMLDAMLRNERSEALKLLGYLREYVVVHFEAEERLMAATSYPDAARHAGEHRAFRTAMASLDKEFLEQGPTATLVLRLERQVVAWLKEHVYFTDVALGRWVLAHRPEPSARAP